MLMENTCTFNGIWMSYSCPLCGKPKNRSGLGQSIVWIVSECLTNGSAISHCDNCGGAFIIPAEIFDPTFLTEARKVFQLPGDNLSGYVKSAYIDSCAQTKMLNPYWGSILSNANKAGPVDLLTIQWNPGEKCPSCGYGPNSHPISFTYTCPACGAANTISQENIDPLLGVRVLCHNCSNALLIPARVWCPRCRRALLDYYEVLQMIADENGMSFEQLEPAKAEASNPLETGTPTPARAPSSPNPIDDDASKPDPEAEHISPVKINTLSDFLKLIGMRIRFTTKQDESYEATVCDLSDTGIHILLADVLRIEYPKVPGEKIIQIAYKDLENSADLSQYVGKRIRLKMKSPGFVEGNLHAIPKERIEMTMVMYYKPSELHSILIEKLDFIEVIDRKATSM